MALVEFALVAILLFGLVFSIIGYAYMMSFQQSLTQAAAEGARAGAVAAVGNAQADARTAVDDALGGFGVDCDSAGMTCTIPPPAPCEGNAAKQCITVTLRYQYRAHPLLPSVPFVDRTLPATVDYTAVAEVNT